MKECAIKFSLARIFVSDLSTHDTLLKKLNGRYPVVIMISRENEVDLVFLLLKKSEQVDLVFFESCSYVGCAVGE